MKRAKTADEYSIYQHNALGNPEVAELLKGKSLEQISAYCTAVLAIHLENPHPIEKLWSEDD